MQDPFRGLGRGAPLFRAVFCGMEFPIKDCEDLIIKAGGPERLVVISDPNGGNLAYSLLDLLEAWPEIDSFFPMESAEAVAKQFAKMEAGRKRARKTSPVQRIKGRHMANLMRERRPPTFDRRPIPQFPDVVAAGATDEVFLKVLRRDEGLAILRTIPDSITSKAMEAWLSWLERSIAEVHVRAAVAAAAEAQESARIAQDACTSAQNSELEAAAAPSQELARQAVDQAYSFSDQARAASWDAHNAAATACANAGAVPNSIQAQTACSQASEAAQQATRSAQGAGYWADRAMDIFCVHVVTIRGHVTESDPCCDDDWEGATITVKNLDYSEVPTGSATTDSDGNYAVVGKFGRLWYGAAAIDVTMDAGPDAEGFSLSRIIYVENDDPPPVNFHFDAPGID